jgi:hypothetical protein
MYQRYPVPWLCRGCAVAVPPRTGEPEPGTICRQSSLRVTTGGICSAQPHRQVWWSPSARRIPNMESEGPGRFQVNELYYLENTWKYLADITIKHDCIQFLSSACIYIYVCVLYIYILILYHEIAIDPGIGTTSIQQLPLWPGLLYSALDPSQNGKN